MHPRYNSWSVFTVKSIIFRNLITNNVYVTSWRTFETDFEECNNQSNIIFRLGLFQCSNAIISICDNTVRRPHTNMSGALSNRCLDFQTIDTSVLFGISIRLSVTDLLPIGIFSYIFLYVFFLLPVFFLRSFFTISVNQK